MLVSNRIIDELNKLELKDHRIAQVMGMVKPVFGHVHTELVAFAGFIKVVAEQ